MRKLHLALAMVAMLCIGLVAGALFTRGARAQTPGQYYVTLAQGNNFQIVPVQRLTADDPLAVVVNAQSGTVNLIRK